ncbi:MAG: type II CAAX endopeptidase family protein [Cyanobacteria bacterium P01_F01_bin.42]
MTSETNRRPRLNRAGLIFLSLWVFFLVGATLYGSWTEPQAQGQIALYQTDLTLEALEWQPASIEEPEQLKAQIFGEAPLGDALEQYQKVRASLLKTYPDLLSESQEDEALSLRDRQQRDALDQLNLKLGILTAQAQGVEEADQYWQDIETAPFTSSAHRQTVETVETLRSVWRSRPVPDAEVLLHDRLAGWFQTQSLSQLLTQSAETEKLAQLQDEIQVQAQSAVKRLAIAVGIPLLGSLVGMIVLVTWGIQLTRQALRRDQSTAPPVDEASSTPLNLEVSWGLDTFWLTMLLWFLAFFGVSLVVPLGLQVVFGRAITESARGQALLALSNYSGLIAAGLGLIVWMTRPYLSNFFRWLPIDFKGSWIKWGLGGYVVALPMVLLISVVNQKLLGDQGGGNPLLDIILRTHDVGTWFVLLFMVSVLAPLFEETVFRGFALTSLYRYFPLWVAVTASALLFAIAHLNIADFLPLFCLGCILGTVYARSKNLLASIMLHSLWNGAQLVELLYLSGGS